EGIQAPEPVDDGTIVSFGGEAARARLDQLVREKPLVLEWEGDRVLYDGAYLCHAVDAEGKLLSEILLEEGLVRLCLEDFAMRHGDVLRAAQVRAQERKAGVWARPAGAAAPETGYYHGVALGMYAQDPEHDYGGFIREMKEFGASHVLLGVSWLMEDWRSNEIAPLKGRTPSWATIAKTSKQAREAGLGVAYLPLVLLRTGNEHYWRGNIQPTQLWMWFRNYGRYVARFADLARDHGASLLSVGSEYTTMERYTGPWKTVIANCRARTACRLTYSANWDHVHEVKFWNDLDVIGMTAYHSLTSKKDPTVQEMTNGWAPIREKLLDLQRELDLPFLFTEIGYPSQDGANTAPWNYYLDRNKPDPQEQSDCFEAFTRAWGDAPPQFQGFFIWEWWRNDDASDAHRYTLWKKPAYEVMKRWIAEHRERRGK
ncbi:MAG TPA: thermonuclease family protein, partial [Planctomycetota bacterium]|nr:thermonuclease family protein [Planctomycetota bacterium]